MAVFGGLVLTNAGRSLSAKAQIGKLLKFKRISIGDGMLGSSESMINLTKLKNEVMSCNISNYKVIKEVIAKITFIINNQDLKEGFYWRELGIIAEDPDTLQEVLYCYGNARENGEYIAAKSGTDILEKRISIDISIDNINNTTAIIDESLIFIDRQEFEESIGRLEIEKANIKDIKVKRKIVVVSEAIPANTDYIIPLNYKVGNDSLEVYSMGERLVKTTINKEGHYKEVGGEDSSSNIIQLHNWQSDIGEIFEFVVKGDYNAT